VSGLETTATLDMETDEWVINTPNIRATKFWPGSMGTVANHAMVFCRLIANECDFGPQPILCPIRSYEDHMPLPGITVGDMGTKLGYNSVDNGFLSFDNVRVPRKNMMTRFSYITKEGDLEMRGDLRMLYNIMVQTRMEIIGGCFMTLRCSLLIATRYACCRR
jgi:acyl-CoA oxidase